MGRVVLRQVIPDGSQYGQLGAIFSDHSHLEFGQDLRGAGSIKFDYPSQGVNSDQLDGETYVVPIINGNDKWHDAIFKIQETEAPNLGEDGPVMKTYAGVSLLKQTEKIRWLPAIGSQYMDDMAFTYTNVTPGAVLKGAVDNFWSRAKSQFNDPIHWLTEVKVSANAAWQYRVDEQVIPGTSLWEMITKYQDLGIATARFEGFRLQTAHFDWYSSGLASDKTDSVQFRVGFNVVESEEVTSYEDICTSLLVRGSPDPLSEEQNPTCAWVQAPASVIKKFGYREDMLEVGEASQQSTLRAVGQAHLNARLAPRFSKTYKVVEDLYHARSGKKIPSPTALVDYQCGDMVTLLDKSGASEYRIYGISISYDSDGRSSISLTLNDYWDSYAVTLDQRLRRLGG